jgi:hypothetical protein
MDAGTPPPLDAGTPAVTGLVEVELSAGIDMFLPITTSVTAGFGPLVAPSTCATRTLGACTVTDCATGEGDAGEPEPTDGGATHVLSAGRLTLDEGSTRVSLEPDPMSGGYQFSEEGERFTPGRPLIVSAAGGAVPAFTATLALPERVTVTAPRCTFGDCGTLDRSMDLPVEWTGAQGPVTLTLSSGSDAAVRIIECRATTSPAAIPAGAMTGMPTEAVLLQVARRSETSARAGAVPVTVRATTQSLFGVYLRVR